MMHWLAIAAVVVGTWNGNWFPSGRAEHRAHPDVEAATVSAAARMLRAGLDAVDPAGTNDVILCLHEMRGPAVASNLVAQIGRAGLNVAIVSGYRRRDRFDMQQDVIATTLPVAERSWSVWRNHKRETPPRGYAFAAVVVDPAVTANVYAVHLKSNYGAADLDQKVLNRVKRGHAIAQLVQQEKPRRGRARRPALVVGDFNADRWSADFAEETIFADLEKAGFGDAAAHLPAASRATHPSSSKRYRDSVLDYIMFRGAERAGETRVISNDSLSDHFALFTLLNFEE